MPPYTWAFCLHGMERRLARRGAGDACGGSLQAAHRLHTGIRSPAWPPRRERVRRSYLRLGFTHIADLRAYDHILFVAALTAAYGAREWRRIAWLVTAFTLGHTVTLALATLDLMRVPATIVEQAIAATIVLTALTAIHDQRDVAQCPVGSRMVAEVRHRGAVRPGARDSDSAATCARCSAERSRSALPLFAFNVGLEAGQILIVAVVFALGISAVRGARLGSRDWVLVLSGATAGIGATMLLDRLLGT
jgi:hypothetical protein